MEASATNQLPCVDWAGHRISRLVLGHNPIKGVSHTSKALDVEMRDWHASPERGLELLRCAQACGINTLQFGSDSMQRLLMAHHRRGGRLQWVATHYNNEAGNLGAGERLSFEDELQRILAVDPPPIAIQHFGERTDSLFFERKLTVVRDHMKRLRDTGLLIGLCTHLPDVVETVAAEDWDLDFYQVAAYTAYAGTRRPGINRDDEIFEDIDRERMFALVLRLDKPCIVFKVLGAGRNCATDAAVREALAYAYASIKPTDVVCVGMWQKYKDQVSQNTAFAREILAP
jgi:hypothetical protein